jgi:hypothetical protein
MLTGSELEIAIAAALFGAVCLGFVLYWLWSALRGGARAELERLDEMAGRLHEAELAREGIEVAWREAEADIARREAGATEQVAAMQTRLAVEIEGREAELARQLSEALLELETMRDGLGNARRRIIDLEAELEESRGEAE